MKRTILAAFGAAAVLAGSALSAQALPFGSGPGASGLIDKVAQGCGPGFARNPWGHCRPMGYGPRPGYGPPPGYRRPHYGPRPPYGPPRFHRGW